MAVEADLRGLSTRRVKVRPMERRIVDTILRRIDKLERDRWTKLQLILPCCCDFVRRTTIFRDFVPSIVAVKRLKREPRPSGPLALVLAGSGRGQESLAVSNLPSIALTPVHLTAWTGSLTRTPAWGHVVRRCPDASRSTARERRSAATGLSPPVWSRKVMPGRISRAWPSPADKRYGRRCGSESSGARAVRMSAVANPSVNRS
jgi:hypothetical protein